MKKAYNKNNKFTGAIYGAWNDSNDPYHKERDRHARMYYQQIRNRDKAIEIMRVSQNSGFTISDVEQIYNHIFIKEHELEDGFKRFNPSYDMAESWRRLSDRNNGHGIQRHDIIMLHHELMELKLMADGYSYEEAHNKTNEVFDYQKAWAEWIQMKGEKDAKTH